ncbi:MAG: hypothetical protein N3Z28_05605 [Synechococcaceae cyanobacterium MAG-AL2]|nr:hypothetical protein [Candidatus Regnicoccus frigidus MAG-AL2]
MTVGQEHERTILMQDERFLVVVFSLEIFLTAEQMVEKSLQCIAPFAIPPLAAELIKLRKTIQWQIEAEALSYRSFSFSHDCSYLCSPAAQI